MKCLDVILKKPTTHEIGNRKKKMAYQSKYHHLLCNLESILLLTDGTCFDRTSPNEASNLKNIFCLFHA